MAQLGSPIYDRPVAPGSAVGAGRSTAIVLFTDLVGSTDLRSRLGEDAAEELRRDHDRLIAGAVEANRGRLVKNLGDGVMATFTGASDALAAAVAIQQALDRRNRSGSSDVPLGVRIGVSAGDVAFEGADCFGTPVIEAARLCAAAGGGRILVTEVVRVLAGTAGGHQFAPVGALDLKGLPAPVPACEVTWESLAEPPLPMPALLTQAGRIFVGRDEEVERLLRLWKEAMAGERRVALLAGEPGIGKTRLAVELAGVVRESGAVVLAGRCDEDLGVPYQPFVEALRHYVTHAEGRRLGRYAGELTRLLPDLTQLVGGLPEPLRSDPETERYRLFDALAAWLSDVSAEAPVLLVLDDLHWAAKPTLLLLRHVLRFQEPLRLLVVVTYRDSDIGRGHPMRHRLSTTVSSCPSEGPVSVGDVDGFVVADVLVEAVPEDLEPPVAEGAQGGVVGFVAGSLFVVELAGPGRVAQGAEGPLLDGVAQEAVAGQSVGHNEFALAGTAGHGGFAGIALERVRCLEAFGMVADLTGDPGGETITEAGKAQVDLAARERLPQVFLRGPFRSSLSGCSQEDRAHPSFPGSALSADGEELGCGQADGVGLGPHEVVPGNEVVGGQSLVDLVGETVRPAMFGCPSEGLQLLVGGAGQGRRGGPAFQQPQERRAAQVVAGDAQGRRERGQQVLAEPVEQAPFIPSRPLIVPGDRTELAGQVTMGHEGPEPLEPIQGNQAGDPGVLGVVLLLGRATATSDKIRVDRHDHVTGVNQGLHEGTVAGLKHDPNLRRVGLQSSDTGHQTSHRFGSMLDPADLEHSVARAAQSDQMELLGPVDPYTKQCVSSPRRTKARRRADGPVLAGRHRCGRQAFRALPRVRRLISVLEGQAIEAFPGGDPGQEATNRSL
jgi:class 3 adenylate cyclase